jgi:hypothetical protein
MNELELSTEELFPPTREELEEILETIQKQLKDPKFEEHWAFLHQQYLLKKQLLKDLEDENF